MLATLLATARQQIFGLLALFVALGGTSYAVATGSIDSREIKNNSVRGKDIRNGTIRSRDVGNSSLLAEDFKSGQLPKGDTGPQGPPGRSAIQLWAWVDFDGTIKRRSSSAITVSVVGPAASGSYEVDFGRDISRCGLFASIGLADFFPGPSGEVIVGPLSAVPPGNRRAVVDTRSSTGEDGVPGARPFWIAALC